jgi:hypothetical protein
MMKIKVIGRNLMLLAGVLLFTVSCSDDEDYNSRLPEFAGLNTNPEVVTVNGDSVVVEIPVSKGGRYVSCSSSTWTITPSVGDIVGQKSDPLDRTNPTCRFAAPTSRGQYEIRYEAKYTISGQGKNTSWSVPFSGGRVSYEMGSLFGKIIVTKTIKVQ